MTLKELLALLKDVGEDDMIDEVIKTAFPVDRAKATEFIGTDDGKALLAELTQSEVDRRITQAVETHDQKQAPVIEERVKAEAAKLYNDRNPKPDPVQQQLADQQKESEKIKADGTLKDTVSQATTFAAQNTIPLNLVDSFFNRGTSLEDFKLFANDYRATNDMATKKAVEDRLGKGAKPEGDETPEGNGRTLADIKAMTSDQRNALLDEIGVEAFEKIVSQ